MNKKLTCIVIDDEPIGKELIVNYVKMIPFLELSHSFEDPILALTYLHSNEVDIIITDINMPQINGIELIKSLNNHPAIIFITAHRDFAVDGFENGVVDYLVKPISYDRFLKAINRAKDKIVSKEEDFQIPKNKEIDRIFIKANGKLVKINLDEILYIEALGDYLKIVTNIDSYTTLATLKSMEETLLSPNFLRVQRSFLVKISAIKSITGNMIDLINGKSISIASNKKEELFKLLGI